MERVRKGAGFGLFLLFVGVIWILANTGIITFSIFDSIWTLWPLILVAIGVGIIFRRSLIARAAVWVVLLAVLIGYSYYFVDKGNTSGKMAGGPVVAIENQAQIKNADLKISFGGAKINLDSQIANGANLLEANLQDSNIVHDSQFNSDGSKASIAFDRKKGSSFNLRFDGNLTNTFHLNPSALWNLDVDTGAADTSLDLSGLQVGKLTLDTGAANTKIVMGSCNSTLKIQGGVTNITIDIPQDTGIRVRMDGGLNNTNLDEPGWEHRDGYIYSPGYDGKTYKIDATADMGVSKLNINYR